MKNWLALVLLGIALGSNAQRETTGIYFRLTLNSRQTRIAFYLQLNGKLVSKLHIVWSINTLFRVAPYISAICDYTLRQHSPTLSCLTFIFTRAVTTCSIEGQVFDECPGHPGCDQHCGTRYYIVDPCPPGEDPCEYPRCKCDVNAAARLIDLTACMSVPAPAGLLEQP